MENMITPQKIWICGNAFAISIPKRIAKLKNYAKGKIIMINWGEILQEPLEDIKDKEVREKVKEEITEEIKEESMEDLKLPKLN